MDRYCRVCHNTACGNHGKDISFLGDGWQCNYIPVPTNADRIRAMNDEELIKLLTGFCAFSCLFPDKDCEHENCEECFKEWLQSPAEKEGE